jgi:hypothetical protein
MVKAIAAIESVQSLAQQNLAIHTQTKGATNSDSGAPAQDMVTISVAGNAAAQQGSGQSASRLWDKRPVRVKVPSTGLARQQAPCLRAGSPSYRTSEANAPLAMSSPTAPISGASERSASTGFETERNRS